MKIVGITLKNAGQAFHEVKEAFDAAKNRKPFKPYSGVAFTSLEAVRNFLTPKRLELIHVIRGKRPESVYALAKLTHRSATSVLRDVEILTRHGLVKTSQEKRAGRRVTHPVVEYDSIRLNIPVI